MGGYRWGMRTFSFRGRAAHVATQVNGNHWLRPNPPPLRDEADIFMYSSQLVCSAHLQMQTLIPPRLCSLLILLEYFSPSLSLFFPPTVRSLPLFFCSCGRKVGCRCCEKSASPALKSLLLTDGLDLRSSREAAEPARRKEQQLR